MKIAKTDAPSRLLWPAAFVAALVLVCLPMRTHGQGLLTGSVAVRVTDTAAQPVTDVLLTLVDSAAGMTRTATANRQGFYRFGLVAPGEYALTVERIGFTPHRLERVVVRPDAQLVLEVALARQRDGGTVELSRESVNAGQVSPVAAREWLPRDMWETMSGETRAVNGVLRFASSATEDLVSEGLPPTLSTLAVDGTLFRTASHGQFGDAVIAPFAGLGFDGAQLISNAVDVEWSGFSGTALSTYTHHGSRLGAGRVLGSFTGDAISVSSFEATRTGWTDIQGNVRFDTSLGESGRFSIGAQGHSTGSPLSPAWARGTAADALVGMAPDLATYGETTGRTNNVISGFAHVDWPTSVAHSIEASVHGAVVPEVTSLESRTGALSTLEGGDFLVNLALRSVLGERTRNEARVTIATTRRSRVLDEVVMRPLTRVVGDGIAFGSDPWLESSREAVFGISDALYYESGSHVLKFGGSVSLGGFEYEPRMRMGEYLYGDIDHVLAGTGVYARKEGTPPIADWTDRTFALFAQDRIAIRPGAYVVLGARVERQMFDFTVRRDQGWFMLTGVANDAISEPGIRVSPRIGLNWDIGNHHRHFLNAAAGVYYDRIDPMLLASWITDDGSSVVRRQVGALPFPSDAVPGGGTTARSLTVLGTEFTAPRTMRASAGFATRMVEGLTFYVGGVARRTENLPRRRDTNKLPLPFAHDQHGREIFGQMEKQGSLITAVPGSNRLFNEYDEVGEITSDATSNHIGFTAGIEYEAAQLLNLVARYTFGHTTDTWFGATQRGWTSLNPYNSAAAEWLDGAADYDVPHRAVVGGVITGPFGVQLGAVYRYQSGYPFTPGYQPGVDANGDGDATNDPAYVDPSIPGIAELMAREPCVAQSNGMFAIRNSCRGPNVQALDMSLSLPMFRAAGGTAVLTVDAFDVLESAAELPDAALYVIDPNEPDGLLVPDGNTITVPLMANPNFGTPLTRRVGGRTIRVGLAFNW